ncbi:MAG: hypothetical protein R2755_19165 [Acidimicrobiales bacterium]
MGVVGALRPPQPEILRYLQHVAERFDLRGDIRFSTKVAGLRTVQDDADGRWVITTDGEAAGGST